jgi:hypothetical protein
MEWRVKWNFSEITTSDDYWPEGVIPNADGHYVRGDLIAVKCPIQDYISKRKHELQVSENAPAAIMRQFNNEAAAVGLDVDEAMMAKIMGSRRTLQ